MTVTTEEAEMLAALLEGKSAPAGCVVTGYNFTTALRSLAAERDALQARVTELEEALRPFAGVGEFIAKHHPDPETDQNHETATLVRHFRNAYIALTGGKDE
jgi:hypothetical protein